MQLISISEKLGWDIFAPIFLTDNGNLVRNWGVSEKKKVPGMQLILSIDGIQLIVIYLFLESWDWMDLYPSVLQIMKT